MQPAARTFWLITAIFAHSYLSLDEVFFKTAVCAEVLRT